MIRRKCAATSITAGSFEKGATRAWGGLGHRLAHALAQAGAEVLAGDGGDGEGDGHGRQEDGLHDPRADAVAGLGIRSEAGDDAIDDQTSQKHQGELAGGRQADVDDAAR